MKKVILILLSLLAATVAGINCTEGDDDSGDDDGGDDDDSYIDDDYEIGCEGVQSDFCADEPPPELLSLVVKVNGEVVETPAVINWTDSLVLAFEFRDTNCHVRRGYPFIVKNGDPRCLENDSLWWLECTGGIDGPAELKISSKYFVDGVGAPYGFEISDYCGNHSNRLPIEIVTVAPDDSDD